MNLARAILAAVLLLSMPAPAAQATCAPFDQQHRAWTEILARYVRGGGVDYQGLKQTGQNDLTGYLQSLENVCRGDYEKWNRNEKLAFWINVYNVFAIKLILDHYPVKSIRSIGLLPLAAFRTSFIRLPGLHEKPLSLNDAENDILRQEFREPRIHFAIVCASKSCPILRSEAYRADDLDAQLDDAARSFLRDASKNHYDATTNTLHLSSIFKWFREDFEKSAGTLPSFVARYTDPATRVAISRNAPRITFLDYDWSLNGR